MQLSALSARARALSSCSNQRLKVVPREKSQKKVSVDHRKTFSTFVSMESLVKDSDDPSAANHLLVVLIYIMASMGLLSSPSPFVERDPRAKLD